MICPDKQQAHMDWTRLLCGGPRVGSRMMKTRHIEAVLQDANVCGKAEQQKSSIRWFVLQPSKCREPHKII